MVEIEMNRSVLCYLFWSGLCLALKANAYSLYSCWKGKAPFFKLFFFVFILFFIIELMIMEGQTQKIYFFSFMPNKDISDKCLNRVEKLMW